MTTIRTMAAAAALLLAVVGPAKADQASAVAAARQLPLVLDAIPDPAGNLWVTVMQRPSVQWNALATQVCQVVVPHHARIFLVKIVDFNSVRTSKKPSDWHMLGGANCGG